MDKMIKYQMKIELLVRWIRLEQSGQSISTLIMNRGYNNVALYGYNEMCRCMLYGLENNSFPVKYIVDKRGNDLPIDFPQKNADEFRGEDIDALIFMLIDADETLDKLQKNALCDVITIEELLYEL